MIEDVEWALRTAIDLLKEFYPKYDSDPDIDTILDVYNGHFD